MCAVQPIVKRAARSAYGAVKPLLPSGTRGYPTRAGTVYFDVSESPMMLRRVLRRYEVDKHRLLGRILRPGDVFVDVGANRGDFSVLAGRKVGPMGRVISVEPEPTNVRWLREALAANGIDDVVTVCECAVSDGEGTATLHVSNRSGAHSLMTEQEGSGEDITVPTRTLDRLLADEGVERPRAVKIDVEGADLLVLRGATELLAATEPLVLLIDLHPHLGADVLAAQDLLTSAGFTLRDPHDPGATVVLAGDEREVVAVRGSVTGLTG